VHRWSILIIVQRDATQSSLIIILQVHSTCFGRQPHPSSGLHKTVTTVSRTVQLPPCTVPEAVVTDLCTPDDGCGWRPKHVEWTCRIIIRLLCVASRWTISNIHLYLGLSYACTTAVTENREWHVTWYPWLWYSVIYEYLCYRLKWLSLCLSSRD